MTDSTQPPEPTLLGLSADRRCPGCGQTRTQGIALPSTGSCPSCNLAFQSWDEGEARPPERPFAQVLEDPAFVSRYEQVTLLTSGGMGAVFTAIDRELDRLVALKLPLTSSEDGMKRFAREGQLLARVSHPNVVKIYSVEVFAGCPAIAFELLSGRSLKSEIVSRGRFEPVRAVELIDRILAGLEAIHQIGIVHRDLKGDNILLVGDDEPRIIDFGLARDTDEEASITRAGIVLGTPAYMAPEQATGGALGPACDIYSAGIILYEMLVGRLPFQADSPIELLRSQITRIPPIASSLNPVLSPGLDRLLQKALEKEPKARFANVLEMREALRAIDWKEAPTPTRELEVPALRRITARQSPARLTGQSRSDTQAMATQTRPAAPTAPSRWRAISGLLVALLLFLAHRISVWEKDLGFRLVAGQRSVVVRLPQAFDIEVSLVPESGGAPIAARIGPGLRRFEGLGPGTAYRLERRTWRGRRELARVSTLPILDDLLRFELASSRDGSAEVRLIRGEGIPAELRVGLLLGDRELAPSAGRDRFLLPLHEITGSASLGAVLPDVTEVIGGPVELLGYTDLLKGLAFQFQQTEHQLLRIRNSCYIPDVSKPGPALFSFAVGAAGKESSDESLRLLGPSVAAWLTAQPIGFEKRWKLAAAVLPLAGAETVAHEKGLPPIGLLSWLTPLVRIEYLPNCLRTTHAKRFELPFMVGESANRFLAKRTESNDAKETMLMANTGTMTDVELPLRPRSVAGNSWVSFLLCMDLEWHEAKDNRPGTARNGKGVDRGSAPPAVHFPRAGIEIELPLITSPTAPSTAVWEGISRRVNIKFQFQAPKDPGLLAEMAIRPAVKPVSRRVGPLHVKQVYQMESVSLPE